MDFWSGLVYNFYGNRNTFLKDKEAIYDYDRDLHVTYGELDQRSSRVAGFLTKRLGVKKGDRIGICSCNRVEFFDLFFASYKTGAILTTYNGLLMPWELKEILNNETPAIVFCDSVYQEKLESFCQELTHPPLLIGLDQEGERGYRQMLQTTEKPDPYEPDPEDILMLIHTGGTTGTPKAAMISYRAVVCNSISTVLSHNLSPSDTTYLMLPLFHTAAWNSISLGLLLAGGKIVLKKRFDVDETYDIIEKERPTFILGVPTMYKRLSLSPKFETTDFSSIRSMRCGAAPLPMALFEIYDAKNLPLCNSYGLTECGPSNFSFPMRLVGQDKLREKAGAVGQPYYFNKVRIVDEHGCTVSPGHPGELQFSGPLTFSGYWNNPEETAKAIHGDWVTTGDIAVCDIDGYYTIIGRKKNMFISGGENIFPIEIENILMKHPAVQDCCVVGVEDAHWGEVGKALVQTVPGREVNPEELSQFMKQYLPTIKRPKYVEFVEKIPRNSVGKLVLKDVEAMK